MIFGGNGHDGSISDEEQVRQSEEWGVPIGFVDVVTGTQAGSPPCQSRFHVLGQVCLYEWEGLWLLGWQFGQVKELITSANPSEVGTSE